MIKQLIITIAIIGASSIVHGQKKTTTLTSNTTEIKIKYQQKGLLLSPLKFDKFSEIIKNCNTELNDLGKKSSKNRNQIIKKYDLKLFKLLDAQQWQYYKAIKKEVEPNKNFSL